MQSADPTADSVIKGDPYLIRATSGEGKTLLRNKLGINDRARLSAQENLFSQDRIKEIRDNPAVLGKHEKADQKLLLKVHEHIFQDVYHKQGENPYPIAGAIRVIGIRKIGDPIYPKPHADHPGDDLDTRLDYAFEQLEKDNHLKGLDRDTFVAKLAKHVTEIWECHFAREGNTRSTAIFTEQLALSAGHKLKPIGRDFRDKLKTAALDMNYEPLKDLFRELMSLDREHAPVKDTLVKDGREAKTLISKATETHFSEMMKPLVAERKAIVTRIDSLKSELKSSNATVVTEKTTRMLNAAKGELRQFDKSFIMKGREIRAKAAGKARQEHPNAAVLAAEYKAQQASKTTARSKEYSRSR